MDIAELKLINRLIRDLSGLKERGIEHLRIGREGTFLQSIAAAVALYQD